MNRVAFPRAIAIIQNLKRQTRVIKSRILDTHLYPSGYRQFLSDYDF